MPSCAPFDILSCRTCAASTRFCCPLELPVQPLRFPAAPTDCSIPVARQDINTSPRPSPLSPAHLDARNPSALARYRVPAPAPPSLANRREINTWYTGAAYAEGVLMSRSRTGAHVKTKKIACPNPSSHLTPSLALKTRGFHPPYAKPPAGIRPPSAAIPLDGRVLGLPQGNRQYLLSTTRTEYTQPPQPSAVTHI